MIEHFNYKFLVIIHNMYPPIWYYYTRTFVRFQHFFTEHIVPYISNTPRWVAN